MARIEPVKEDEADDEAKALLTKIRTDFGRSWNVFGGLANNPAVLEGLLAFLMPLYDAEGKAYLTIAVGCTGGRHRAPAIAAALSAKLRSAGREVNLQHRDLEQA